MEQQERVARNEAIFRGANESIASAADEQGVEGILPFICECGTPDCTQIVQATRAEYEAVRAHPTWFLSVAGHFDGAKIRVVQSTERYMVTEKLDRAGEVAEELDPRSGAEAG